MSLVTKNALLALLVTVLIIGTVFYAIEYLDRRRTAEISSIANQLATDTLSLETQFSLLEDAPCETLGKGGLLSELSDLGDRLSFTEERLGSDDAEVIELKKQYTLLEIRDYLLTKRLATACKLHPGTVLYFYANGEDCETCDRAGYALSYLRETYPTLRVYSFDYDLQLGALATLVAVENIEKDLPAFVIQGETHYGFTDLDELKSRLPEELLETATSTPTEDIEL